MPGSASWTPERDALMAECFGRKMSCAATAAVINEKFGSSYSRNAVIGRALRKGIATAGTINLSHRPTRDPAAWRSSGITKRAYQRREAKARSRKDEPTAIGIVDRTKRRKTAPQHFACEPITGLRIADVVPLHVALIELEHGQCRWPYGDGPYTFCGCEQFDGSSYCEPHAALSQGQGTISERLARYAPRAA